MASFIHPTSTILTLIVLFMSPLPGLSTRPDVLTVIDNTLEDGWSIMNILEQPVKNSRSIKQDFISTRVILKNNAIGTLKFHDNMDWSGEVVGSYPSMIPMFRVAQFWHQPLSSDPNGSTGAVIYLSPNLQGEPDKCGFVLAWSNPVGKGSLDTIYIESGVSINYAPSDTGVWDEIYNNLVKFGKAVYSSTHQASDDCAHIKATATITAAGNLPIVNANFFV